MGNIFGPFDQRQLRPLGAPLSTRMMRVQSPTFHSLTNPHNLSPDSNQVHSLSAPNINQQVLLNRHSGGVFKLQKKNHWILLIFNILLLAAAVATVITYCIDINSNTWIIILTSAVLILYVIYLIIYFAQSQLGHLCKMKQLSQFDASYDCFRKQVHGTMMFQAKKVSLEDNLEEREMMKQPTQASQLFNFKINTDLSVNPHSIRTDQTFLFCQLKKSYVFQDEESQRVFDIAFQNFKQKYTAEGCNRFYHKPNTPSFDQNFVIYFSACLTGISVLYVLSGIFGFGAFFALAVESMSIRCCFTSIKKISV